MKQRGMIAGLILLLLAGTFSACGRADTPVNSYKELSDFSLNTAQENARLEGIAAAGNAGDDSQASDDERITAAGAVTITADTGKIVFSHQAKETIANAPFAFLAAVMAAEEAGPGEEASVIVTGEMLSGAENMQCAGLQIGDSVTISELVIGSLIGGYYDTTMALALASEDGQAAFVGRMNQLADRIGMEQTNYVHPYTAEEGQTTSAYDLVCLYREAMNQDSFLQMSGESWHELLWQRADGSQASYGITSRSASLTASLAEDLDCTIIGSLLTETGENGYSWLLYYRNAAGDYRISALIGVSDPDTLIDQMKILLAY